MKIEPGGSGTFCTVFVFSCWCGRESRQVIFGKKSVGVQAMCPEWYDCRAGMGGSDKRISIHVPTRGTTLKNIYV